MQTTMPTQIASLEQIDNHLREGRPEAAEALGLEFTKQYPDNVDGWVLLGRAWLDLIRFANALDAGERAIAIDPHHPVARLLLIEGLLRCGRSAEAIDMAKQLENERKYDPVVLLKIGNLYSQTNRHAEAGICYERVRVLQPTNRDVVYHLASAYIALGELDRAEKLFNDLLRKVPHSFDAYYIRCNLRKQTADSNHVAQMENVLNNLLIGGDGEATLCYALAKELEDLGESQRAFAYLQRGANARKRSLGYHVGADLALMDALAAKQDDAFFAAPRSGYTQQSPIFVLGMPRSGTTLVDRILSSHSGVESVGETGEFSRALMRNAGIEDGPEIVERSSNLDFETVGREYCNSIRGLLPGSHRLIDKTPPNFYYIGMILTALPNAKIICLRRHPVDSCYALYKTLFRGGFHGYSYDLRDLGRFYVGFSRLMDHWRRLFPGRFLEVQYEDLVDNQEEMTRRMLAFCDLDWEDACLAFEKNSSPSLTASAAQVRRPIYRSSVGLWKRYEQELQPLVRALKEGGVAVD